MLKVLTCIYYVPYMALFLTYTLLLQDTINLDRAAAPSNHKTHLARQGGQSLCM